MQKLSNSQYKFETVQLAIVKNNLLEMEIFLFQFSIIVI